MTPRLLLLAPLCIFLIIGGFLWKGLALKPQELPSVLIGQTAPPFQLSTVEDPTRHVTEALFQGHVTILNIWATWCSSCQTEHELWMQLAKKQDALFLVGLNYHDGLEDAKNWLKNLGNPYRLTLFDQNGRVGMDYGVYGTPETFIIDKRGVIRHRHVGPMDAMVWQEKLLPMIGVLENEK